MLILIYSYFLALGLLFVEAFEKLSSYFSNAFYTLSLFTLETRIRLIDYG